MSPREPGRKTSGAYIERTSTGRGRLCFRWRGKLHRITTELDADADRLQLEKARDLIGAEIRAGIFDPTQRFPSLFAPRLAMPAPLVRKSLLVEMTKWIEEKEKRRVRKSRTVRYRSHLRTYFTLSALADRDPTGLTFEDFKALQLWLVSEAGEDKSGVSEKTAANVIRGTLKAFLRDLGLMHAVAELKRLTWERTAPTREQDPFTAVDRDRLFAWFRARRPFEEYVSLRLRFLGASPSEVRGFNVGDFDRANGALLVRRSRDLGEIGATKTKARGRAVFLSPDVAADVSTLCGLRERSAALLAVAEDTLRDNFNKAQAALGIAHRALYQAKHTFATLSLIEGWSSSIVARNLGISLATLERNYAAALQQGRIHGNPFQGVSPALRSAQERKPKRKGRASV